MRKFLAFIFIILVFYSFLIVANATESNEQDKPQSIVINGIDIGYDDGDYFTKDGKACQNCHGTGICIESGYPCNCMRFWPTGNYYDCEVDLRATQCMGFARYCQWAVYGVHERQDPEQYVKDYPLISGKNVEEVKSRLLNCSPATHIRVYPHHSITVIETSDTDIQIAEANYNGCCQIRTVTYTWEEFAAYIYYRGGIHYIVEHIPTINDEIETEELTTAIIKPFNKIAKLFDIEPETEISTHPIPNTNTSSTIS